MARLRIRLVFNPGRIGAPMDKLGEFSSQTERFLRSLSFDLGIEARKGEWIAENFTNDSVSFDAEFAAPVPDEVAIRGREALLHRHDFVNSRFILTDAPAARAGEVAGVQRLQHHHHRKFFGPAKALAGHVFREFRGHF